MSLQPARAAFWALPPVGPAASCGEAGPSTRMAISAGDDGVCPKVRDGSKLSTTPRHSVLQRHRRRKGDAWPRRGAFHGDISDILSSVRGWASIAALAVSGIIVGCGDSRPLPDAGVDGRGGAGRGATAGMSGGGADRAESAPSSGRWPGTATGGVGGDDGIGGADRRCAARRGDRRRWRDRLAAATLEAIAEPLVMAKGDGSR